MTNGDRIRQMSDQDKRKCIVEESEMIFHGWFQYSEVVEPSPMVGGHSGGQLQYPVGVVEDEDGAVIAVPAWNIKFIHRIPQEECKEGQQDG